MRFNPAWIVGKTVARVEMNTQRHERSGGGDAHDPEIFFTDGSSIIFTTEETSQAAWYGTSIGYRKPQKGKSS